MEVRVSLAAPPAACSAASLHTCMHACSAGRQPFEGRRSRCSRLDNYSESGNTNHYNRHQPGRLAIAHRVVDIARQTNDRLAVSCRRLAVGTGEGGEGGRLSWRAGKRAIGARRPVSWRAGAKGGRCINFQLPLVKSRLSHRPSSQPVSTFSPLVRSLSASRRMGANRLQRCKPP